MIIVAPDSLTPRTFDLDYRQSKENNLRIPSLSALCLGNWLSRTYVLKSSEEEAYPRRNAAPEPL